MPMATKQCQSFNEQHQQSRMATIFLFPRGDVLLAAYSGESLGKIYREAELRERSVKKVIDGASEDVLHHLWEAHTGVCTSWTIHIASTHGGEYWY